MIVKLCPIKSKVSSPLKITKLFQFQNSVFLTVFNGYCSLLPRFEMAVVYAMHDGQDLKHPLSLSQLPGSLRCRVLRSRSMYIIHVTLCTRILQFWNIFNIKILGDSWFILTDGYLWLWSFVTSSQNLIRLSKLQSYFTFNTPPFPQLFLLYTTVEN